MKLPDLSKFTTAVAKMVPDFFVRYWISGGKLQGFTVVATLAKWHDALDDYMVQCGETELGDDFIFDGTSHDSSAKTSGEEFGRSWHFYMKEKVPVREHKPLLPGTYWSDPHGRYIEPEDPEWSGCDYDRICAV